MSRRLHLLWLSATLVASCTEPCKDGTVDCGCLSGDRCDAGLVCVLGVCTDPGEGVCGDGKVGQGEQCDGNAVLNGSCGENCRLSCNLGYDDCNADPSDGCETDIRSSLAHCGGCLTPCSSAGGVASCENGNCTLTCSTGYADCNMDVSDGCEVSLDSDPHNCGTCAHDCLGGGCAGGHCLPVLFAAETATQDVALDADYVYFTSLGTAVNDYADGAVIRVDKVSRARLSLAAPEKTPAWLAVDDAAVFWARLGSAPNYLDGAINAVPKTGGAVLPLATAQEFPGALVLDPGHVYWTTGSASGRVGRIAKSGGVLPDWLATGQATPRGVVVDQQHLYWTNRYGSPKGAVMVADLDGANPQPFADLQDGPYQLAADATTVFWVNWDTNSLMRSEKSTPAATLVEAEQGPITGLAVDSQGSYWGVDRGHGASVIRELSRLGGEVTTLASAIDSPGALAVDSVAVYWTSTAGIMRLAR